MMGIVGRLGRVLAGPQGLMPSPQGRHCDPNVGSAVKEIKAGKSGYRLDKTNIIHCPIGKGLFLALKLQENMDTLLAAVVKAKPAAAKGSVYPLLRRRLHHGPRREGQHCEILSWFPPPVGTFDGRNAIFQRKYPRENPVAGIRYRNLKIEDYNMKKWFKKGRRNCHVCHHGPSPWPPAPAANPPLPRKS